MTTTNRDFDRIARAWLDLMPDEAPDRSMDAVLQAIELTPQVRPRLGWPTRRFTQMPRFTLGVAAVAIVLIVVVGGARLLSTSPSVGRSPSPTVPSATPTTVPTATPLVDGLGRGMGYPTPAPDPFQQATWVATAPPITGFSSAASSLRLTARDNGLNVEIDGTLSAALASVSVTTVPESVALVSSADSTACRKKNVGQYSIVPGSDGVTMNLVLVRDDCAIRGQVLGRTWVRSLDQASSGGSGVVTVFSPMLLVTLPEKAYDPTFDVTDALMVENPDGSAFVAVRNPYGWSKPCEQPAGSKVPIEPTVDAFAAYMDSLPGFSVERTDVEIDGRPAVHLTVPSTPTPECQKGGPTNGRVIEWTTSVQDFGGGWQLTQGDTDSMYLVEVDGSLFLLQWLGAGFQTPAQELSILDTVHFVDTLPTFAP